MNTNINVSDIIAFPEDIIYIISIHQKPVR